MPNINTPNTALARMVTTPWSYGWNVVGATVVFQCVVFGLLIYSFTFWVEPWSQEFGASRGEIMVAISAFNVMVAAMGPFVGRAMDHLPVRYFVIAGAFSCSAGFMLLSVASAAWHVIAIFAIIMAGTAILSGPLAAQTLVTLWFHERRGRALGISALGTSIGGFIFPIVTTALIATYGWREASFILGVMALLVLVPVAWAVVADPDHSSLADDASTPQDGSLAVATPLERDWRVGEVLRERCFWILIFTNLPLMISFSAIQFNLGPLMQDFEVPQQMGALVVSAMAVSMIFGKLFFGSQADRRSHNILLVLMAIGFALCAVAFLSASSFITLMPAAIVMGFATGGFLPLMAAIIGSRFGTRSFGRVIGMTGPVLAVGAIGPLVAGRVRDITGSYDLVFIAVIILALISAMTGYFLPDKVKE